MNRLVEYDGASAEVRAVYDDIMQTRNVNWINNFWKAIANHPPTLIRTWSSIKEIMAEGALDIRTKELIYLAISANNGCDYCIASHGASARRAGMTDEMFVWLSVTAATVKAVTQFAVSVVGYVLGTVGSPGMMAVPAS